MTGVFLNPRRLIFMQALLVSALAFGIAGCEGTAIDPEDPVVDPTTSAGTNSGDRRPYRELSESERRERARQNYRNAHRNFQQHHRAVFRELDRNYLRVENRGDRAVESLRLMEQLLTEEARKAREELVTNFIDTWERFDPEEPSIGIRTQYQKLGSRIISRFRPENVPIRTPDPVDPEALSGNPDTVDGADTSETEEPDTPPPEPEDPETYSQLFSSWYESHIRFQRGIRADDPLIEQTYQDLTTHLRNMREQLGSPHTEMIDDYLETYEKHFQNRSDVMGTSQLEEELSRLSGRIHQTLAPR